MCECPKCKTLYSDVCPVCYPHLVMAMASDRINREIQFDLFKREQLGKNKYGVTVSDNPLVLTEWLQHAYEEALDLAVYLKRAQRELAVSGKIPSERWCDIHLIHIPCPECIRISTEAEE